MGCNCGQRKNMMKKAFSETKQGNFKSASQIMGDVRRSFVSDVKNGSFSPRNLIRK